MTLMSGQEVFYPSWPSGGVRTRSSFDDVQGSVIPEIFPGASGGVAIERPNVVVAILALGAIAWVLHHRAGRRRKR